MLILRNGLILCLLLCISFLPVVGQKVDIKTREQLAQVVVSRLLNPDAPEQIYLLRKSLYADEIAKKMNTGAVP